MVGGEGRRLRPLTHSIPKPLLTVGNRPILEHTLLLLRGFGVTEVTLAVNYLADVVEERIGDGGRFGMHISYQRERKPLGTAGALGELRNFGETVLMMNGDILTDLNIEEMLAWHRSQGAVMTIASKLMYTDLNLGVLDVTADGRVGAYREKPRIAHRFGLGVYVVEPSVKSHIASGERLDVPELVSKLIGNGDAVTHYDHDGRWIDIGAPEDYARAQEEALPVMQFTGAGA